MNQDLRGKHTAETRKPFQKDQKASDDLDLNVVFRLFWRGKWVIAACASAAAVVGAYHALNNTVPLYTATTVVALEAREEQVSPIASVFSGIPLYEMAMITEFEILQSREFGHRLVDRLDLMDDPEFGIVEDGEVVEPSLPARAIQWFKETLRRDTEVAAPVDPAFEVDQEQAQREAVVSSVLGAITIDNIDYSAVFTISSVSESPVKAALLSDSLAEIYIEDQLQRKFEATDQAVIWLSERASELQADLEASEAAAKSFNASIDLVNVDVLEAMNRQLKDMRDRADETRREAERVREDLATLEAAVETGNVDDILLAAGDTVLAQIAENTAPGTPPATEEAFRNRLERVLVRKRLDAARLEDQSQVLDTSVAELAESVDRQSRDLVTLQQLEREVEANRLIYESFLVRLREMSTQYGIQKADGRVISQAVVPQTPFAPNKKRIVLVAFLAGLFGGFGIVVLRELLRSGIRTAEELEAGTGYSVIGQIPVMPIRRRSKLVPYIVGKPTSPAAEAVRDLRTSIELSNLDTPPQVILVTSCVPGEGKTTNSIQLAHHYSALDNRVLLMEGDIRRRVMNQYFDIKDKPGFVSVLSGKQTLDEAIVRDSRVGIDILPGESVSVSAADIFASARFGAFIEELRGRYDKIIVDTPPVLLFPDARLVAPHSDAVLLCVRWDKTSLNSVQQGIGAVTSVGGKLTGLALSYVNPKALKQYGYSYEYGNYGRKSLKDLGQR